MRIQFEFKINELPITYRLVTLSIIKQMIRNGSRDYYDKCFQINRGKMKSFSHASYIKNLNIEADKLFGERLFLTVSSSSYEFIMHLMNGSQRNNLYQYKDFEFKLLSKRLLPAPPELTSKVTFKTLSPILIEDLNERPLLANDKNFEKELNYYAQLLAKELLNRDLYEPIKIVATSTKKVVIKENLHQEQIDPIFITANHGLLQLKGNPLDLKMIYDNGIGRRRSLGLGLLEIEEVKYDGGTNTCKNG